MIIRMGGPGGAIDPQPPKSRHPNSSEQMNAAMRAQRRDQDVSRLMLGWFAMAHPVAQRAVQLRRRGGVPRRQGLRHRREGRRWLRRAALHRSEQQAAADADLQGPQPRMMTDHDGGPGGRPRDRRGAGPPRSRSDEEEAKKQKADRDKQIAGPQDGSCEAGPDGRLLALLRRLARSRRRQLPAPHAACVRTATTTEEWKINKVKVNPKIDAKKFAVEIR